VQGAVQWLHSFLAKAVPLQRLFTFVGVGHQFMHIEQVILLMFGTWHHEMRELCMEGSLETAR